MIISFIRILFWIPLGSDILFTFDRIMMFPKEYKHDKINGSINIDRVN